MDKRLQKVRKLLEEKNLDACIITGRPNTIYYSGFTGSTSMLLVGLEKAWLVTDFRYTIQARGQVTKDIEVVEQQESFYKTINGIISENSIESIGFEGSVLTFSEYQKMKISLTKAKSLVNLENALDRFRMIKDEEEIELIQQAVLLGDKVFDHIVKFIKPGMKETEVSAEIEYMMKKLGAKGPSFETIVAAGHRSAMCHGTATDNVIKRGDAVVLDFGLIYLNYCSDMTRTIFIGEPDKELTRIYGIVREAQEAALAGIRSGMKASDADRIARDIIARAGYGDAFGHSLGHGVGVEIHEEPRLSVKSKDILADGMVFSVEPGIYLEGLGGVRIEDMVVLVGGKIRNFTTSPKDMIII
ncbi:MAG TPA: aminopeptidase P family protein [Clostridiaceae bacterium]|nr:aminopeptidase P family protein [Clostridiaceae bacterium]